MGAMYNHYSACPVVILNVIPISQYLPITKGLMQWAHAYFMCSDGWWVWILLTGCHSNYWGIQALMDVWPVFRCSFGAS